MKNSIFSVGCAVVIATVITGCATVPSGRGPLPVKYYSKAELQDMDEVKLPANYSVDNFRKMQMVLNIKVESADGKTKINKSLSTRMQTEMAKLKRFEIFSLHNRINGCVGKVHTVHHRNRRHNTIFLFLINIVDDISDNTITDKINSVY